MDVGSSEKRLDGLNGQGYEVMNKCDFFLYKWLCVPYTCQKSVVACGGEGTFANLFVGNE